LSPLPGHKLKSYKKREKEMKIKFKPEEQHPALRFWIDKKNLLV
jgi:hypothetical protein